jgi:ribosomal protein S18 acetylase RimI-like enzyme
MVAIELYKPSDFDSVKSFVEAIQEHERKFVPELRTGVEISDLYVKSLIDNVNQKQGVCLIARDDDTNIGFAAAWLAEDDDPLLQQEARTHAYVSDMFVSESWRRRGIARQLLQAIETEMKRRGCKRIRLFSKAGNLSALKCYEANDYKAYEIILSKVLS